MLHVTRHTLHDNGFTLIEMIITLAILVIMTGVIVTFFIFLYHEQAADIIRIRRINIASHAIKIMSSEIRKMSRAEDGSYTIESASGQTLIFYSDVDNDGLTEKIEYSLSGTNLERKIIEPTGDPYEYTSAETVTVTARDIRNGTDPIFKYYDESYTGSEASLGDPVNVTAIKLIEISLDINSDNNYLTQPFHIETKIHPRNLKEFN